MRGTYTSTLSLCSDIYELIAFHGIIDSAEHRSMVRCEKYTKNQGGTIPDTSTE